MLPERDHAFLTGHHAGHRIVRDGGEVAVVLPDFQLPAGFSPRTVELLLLIPFGYPDSPLDMFWVSPHVTLHRAVPAATSDEVHLGRTWQRFSRHLPPGTWRPGVDGIQSYLATVMKVLSNEAGPEAVAA